MVKIVVKRTAEQKVAAKKRFGALIGSRVERSMYLEGQAVPQERKTPRVSEMRARTTETP